LLRITAKEEEAGDFPEEESEEEAKEAEFFLPLFPPYFNTPEYFFSGNLGQIQSACPLRPVTSAAEVRN